MEDEVIGNVLRELKRSRPAWVTSSSVSIINQGKKRFRSPGVAALNVNCGVTQERDVVPEPTSRNNENANASITTTHAKENDENLINISTKEDARGYKKNDNTTGQQIAVAFPNNHTTLDLPSSSRCQFPGFTTGNGRVVKPSKEALKRARAFLQIEENPRDNDAFSEKKKKIIDEKKKKTTFQGFTTGNGKKVHISEEGLARARQFLQSGTNMKSKKVNSDDHQNNKIGTSNSMTTKKVTKAFTGFSTGNGQKVKVSEESLRRAKAFLNDDAHGTNTTTQRKSSLLSSTSKAHVLDASSTTLRIGKAKRGTTTASRTNQGTTILRRMRQKPFRPPFANKKLKSKHHLRQGVGRNPNRIGKRKFNAPKYVKKKFITKTTAEQHGLQLSTTNVNKSTNDVIISLGHGGEGKTGQTKTGVGARTSERERTNEREKTSERNLEDKRTGGSISGEILYRGLPELQLVRSSDDAWLFNGSHDDVNHKSTYLKLIKDCLIKRVKEINNNTYLSKGEENVDAFGGLTRNKKSVVEGRKKILTEKLVRRMCNERWIHNHLRWILWKLSSKERVLQSRWKRDHSASLAFLNFVSNSVARRGLARPFQTLVDYHKKKKAIHNDSKTNEAGASTPYMILTWDNIIEELVYRSQREHAFAHRSSLHKIFEGDIAPQRFVILMVSAIRK
eukprot:g3861.t1